jgi:hypothetical protein
MRVVARSAGESTIAGRPPASAFLESIWLESDIDRAIGSCFHNIQRCSVTGPTKINRVCGRQVSGIENGPSRFVYLAVSDGANVINAGPVAGFAVNAGLSAHYVEFRTARRSGGVAPKTLCGV